MLRFENVSFSYEGRKVLLNFNFSAKEGEATCILGPSGLGKTTLLSLSAGILKPAAGIIEPLSGKASFVFQEDRLLPWFTAAENLKAVGISPERAAEYLSKVGLGAEADKFPAELSGGMKRRLAVARALAAGGEVFFFDELLQGLDLKTAGEILSFVKSEISGKTALIITHSPAEAFALGERIVLMGKSPLEILADVPKSNFASEAELSEYIKKFI